MNCTGTIGQIVGAATTNTTGSIFLTFLFVILFLVGMAMVFRVPLVYTAIIIMPLLLSLMSYYQSFIPLGGVLIIYLGIIITNDFILK